MGSGWGVVVSEWMYTIGSGWGVMVSGWMLHYREWVGS